MSEILEKPQAAEKVTYNIRQVLKSRVKLGEFRLQPGMALYEMICVSSNGESVAGLNPVTGDFDPDLAVVRPVKMPKPVVVAGDHVKALLGNRNLGKIKPGTHARIDVVDGNLYEVAINGKNARRKIIEKYFEPFK